jgi:ribonucleotide monophosphatase NagD (HAD superfamily)
MGLFPETAERPRVSSLTDTVARRRPIVIPYVLLTNEWAKRRRGTLSFLSEAARHNVTNLRFMESYNLALD